MIYLDIDISFLVIRTFKWKVTFSLQPKSEGCREGKQEVIQDLLNNNDMIVVRVEI